MSPTSFLNRQDALPPELSSLFRKYNDDVVVSVFESLKTIFGYYNSQLEDELRYGQLEPVDTSA